MAFWKDSMINQLSNIINHNRSAAKISQVLYPTENKHGFLVTSLAREPNLYLVKSAI